MALNGRSTSELGLTVEKAMAGILALMIDEREHRVQGDKDALKIEVLLARAGLSNEDIAAVTGKNANAIRVALHRAKAKEA
jgi:hypothetical protein